MNREEKIIQQAVKEFPRFAERRIGFIAGAKWSDEHPNICHDSNKEQPTPGSRVLVLSNDDSIEVLTNVLEVSKNKKWIYFNDLLPKD